MASRTMERPFAREIDPGPSVRSAEGSENMESSTVSPGSRHGTRPKRASLGRDDRRVSSVRFGTLACALRKPIPAERGERGMLLLVLGLVVFFTVHLLPTAPELK